MRANSQLLESALRKWQRSTIFIFYAEFQVFSERFCEQVTKLL